MDLETQTGTPPTTPITPGVLPQGLNVLTEGWSRGWTWSGPAGPLCPRSHLSLEVTNCGTRNSQSHGYGPMVRVTGPVLYAKTVHS